uniref:HIT-type domain-containing protein n=1 Tax=Globisporangium ultimum (strain ATCC 200006 / CBS 805.95 / DAOM BR144) TaxID=431595 RepID=K3WZF7_GLOUD
MERVPIRLGKLRTSVTESRAQPAVRILDASIGHGDASGAALFAASTARVCRICTQHTARYTCPRCNAPYCSVACYKHHGEACTEQFYETHVRDAMQLGDAASAQDGERGSTSKMNAMLSRVKAFQDEASGLSVMDENEDQDDAQEMLERLALMDEEELSLDALTPAQRAQFLAEVADGRLSKFITLWTPWWMLDPHVYERETTAKRRGIVIQEIGSMQSEALDDSEDEAPVARIESGAAFPVGMFTSAMANAMAERASASIVSSASPLLHFHMAELLFSYALVLRTFNGDWQQDVGGAVSALLHLCDVLRADAKYESAELVLYACLRKRMDAAHDGGVLTSDGANDDAQLAVHDATRLLRAKVFVLDAASDTSAMLAAYSVHIPKTEGKKKLALVARKLQFFQMWAFHTPEAAFQATAAQLVHAAAAIGATER